YQLVEHARSAVKQHGVSGVAGMTIGAVGSAVRTGGAVIFVAFLTLFVQLGGRDWFNSLVGLAPEPRPPSLRRMGSGISRAVGGYVSGNLLISVIAGSVATVALLATGVPYAIPLGLLVAVFDLIPMVGATTVTIIVGAAALSHSVTAGVIVVAT